MCFFKYFNRGVVSSVGSPLEINNPVPPVKHNSISLNFLR